MDNGQKYVSPLYRVPEGGLPEQGATGTWVAIGSERFLITAAHAVDKGFTWIPTATGLRRLTSPGVSTTSPASGRDDDRCDLAIYHLANVDQSSKHPSYDFVDVSMIDVNLSYREGNFFEFTGYPFRLGTFDIKKGKADPIYFSVIAEVVSEKKIEQLGLSIHRHIVVAYLKKNLLKDGKPINPPLSHGISGGAVWKVERGSERRALVGIGIENPKGCLVGIRISAALEYIRSRFPHLAPLIPTPVGLDLTVTENGNPVEPVNRAEI